MLLYKQTNLGTPPSLVANYPESTCYNCLCNCLYN
nr:MAG TPA: hypothetical protein [Crassvirales sp.]